MVFSKFAVVAITASLLVGTSGCGLVSPVASRIEYAPADGSQAELESIKVRNFIYLTNGTVSALAGSVVNSGLENATLKISYTDVAVNETKEVTLTVNAGQKLDLGFNGSRALAINLGGKAGDAVTVTVSSGAATKELSIPVLDGTFDFYKPIIDSLSLVEPSTN